MASVNKDWAELPCPAPGHRNFIHKDLAKKYDKQDGKYVLVMHVENKGDHFIVGIFDSLRDSLMARCYGNLGVTMGSKQKLDTNCFYQVHEFDGTIIDDMIYSAESNSIREV
tara:strand:+ start:360 stop:695 length:336 start_codon:yes stop_codon:yes gene_type:complete